MTIDLDALEALANAATPGPWELTDFNEGEDPPRPLWGVVNPPYYNPLDHPDEEAAEVQVHVGGREDAEFIAAARKALPELIAEVRQLREHSQQLNAVGWRLAEALGLVTDGMEELDAEPMQLAGQLIARDAWRAALVIEAEGCPIHVDGVHRTFRDRCICCNWKPEEAK